MFFELLFSLAPAIGQDTGATTAVDSSKLEFVLIPYVISSPETSVAFGALTGFTFSASPRDKRRSNILAGAQYTLKNQYLIFSIYNLSFRQEQYFAQGRTFFDFFPDRYYGIGPDSKASDEEEVEYNSFLTDNTVYRKAGKNHYAGVRFRWVRRFNMQLQEEGLLQTGDVPGARGYTTFGIGPAFLVDTRDNLQSTYTGHYIDLNMVFHADFLGTDFPFNHLRVDGRKFFMLSESKERILAFQFLGIFNSNGAAPFKELAELGGDQMMRGHFTGRFRDNSLMALQAEFRTPLFWKISGVAFAGTGNVAPSLKDFDTDLKPSVGMGLRAAINEKERVKIRFDLAWGGEALGIYFGINEAF